MLGTRDLERYIGHRVVAEDERIWRYLNEVLVIWHGEKLSRKLGKACPQPGKTAALATGLVNRTV